jgi:hypothetical protein
MRAVVLTLAGLLVCAMPAQAKSPIIVELYTSQGCGSCAEAGQLLDDLATREDLVPLVFSVDYWDYLGWKDTFARPEFSERQRRYAKHLTQRAVYTPQVVVDGRGHASAGEIETIEELITAASEDDVAAPSIELGEDTVAIGWGASRTEAAEVWLIRYDPRGQGVDIRSGENRGRTLTYRNVVRELAPLGDWTGRSVTFELPEASQEGLVSLVVLQAAVGEILTLTTR